MNLLFKSIFVDRILSGEKTVTRRRKIPRYKVGAIVCAKTSYPEKPFARLRITRIVGEGHLGNSEGAMTSAARREGCDSWRHFRDIYALINGEDALRQPCVKIEFEVVK